MMMMTPDLLRIDYWATDRTERVEMRLAMDTETSGMLEMANDSRPGLTCNDHTSTLSSDYYYYYYNSYNYNYNYYYNYRDLGNAGDDRR